MKQHILLTEGVYNKNQLKPWSPPSKGTGNGSGKGTPTSISDIMDNNSNDSHEEGNERAKDVMKDKGNPKIDPKDLDKHSKEAEKKMSQDGDGTKAPVKVGDPEGKSTANGNPGSGKASTSTQVERVFSAKVNWKTIIRNFVSKSIQTVEDETWRRPSRRSAASADVQIKQVGASAIRPAKEMREFVVMNCAIVIDTSGSMASAVPRVFVELRLLMKEPQFANCVMPVLHFNDGPGDKFLVDINKNKSAKVESFNESKPIFNASAQTIFNEFISGGTNLAGVDNIVQELVSAGYNVLIISDTDVLYGNNRERIVSMMRSKGDVTVYFLADSKESFQIIAKELGSVTVNMSHM